MIHSWKRTFCTRADHFPLKTTFILGCGMWQVLLQRGGKALGSLGIHLKDGPHFLLVLGVEDGVVKERRRARFPH